MDNKLTELSSEQARLKNIIKIGFGSQSEFARALSMNPQEFTNYFGGRRGFGEALREKLESVGVSYEYFKSGTGSPYNLTEAGQQLAQKFGATPVISAPAKAIPNQQPHKWALVREWLTETGTMAEWYFLLQQVIGKLPLDYVLSLEGKAPEHDKNTVEWYDRQVFTFVRERGIDPNWIFNDDQHEQFAENEAGEALKARLIARYAPKSGTVHESSAPLQYSEPELSHQDL